MDKYNLKRRSRSEATYVKRNPTGNPFTKRKGLNHQQIFLKALGLGFYWGEGTKADKYNVRICNSDPKFIQIFLRFLKEIYQIKEKRLRFALHLFDDIDPDKAINYWCKELHLNKRNFLKTQIIKLNRKGTYIKKSKYGVLTLIFYNKKLRDIINKEIEEIKSSCS